MSKPYTYSELAKKEKWNYFKSATKIKEREPTLDSFLKSGTVTLHAFVSTRITRKKENYLRLVGD